MKDEVTIVFLHGAGTGPWIWQSVRDSLPGATAALAVPSRQDKASPESCAKALVAEMDALGLSRVAVVMHSLAGVLGPELAARLGDRLVTAIFLAAVIPPPGRRFVDAIGIPNGLVLRALFKFNPSGLRPSEKMLRSELCADLSTEDAAVLVDRYEAEWPGLYLGRVGATDKLPRPAYIKLSNDCSLLPKLQDRMIKSLQDPHVLTLDAGHMAMLSKPIELGKMVLQLNQSTQ